MLILDECGLIRRHFLSNTIRKSLCPVYKRFVRLLKDSGTVVLLQDDISRDNVQFYTDIENIDCDSRDNIVAVKMEKPREIHPIKYSKNCFAAVHRMVECYKNGRSRRDGEGAIECTQSFMVFSSSLVMAEFLVLILKDVARQNNADPNRIQGIWSSIKEETEFARQFANDPNACASDADVVACMSVVGLVSQ